MASKIEWTDETWNPVSGCTPVSSGCENCYAERMAKRLGRIAGNGYDADDPFKVTLQSKQLGIPYRWRQGRRIFVCSMSDLYHKDVPDDYIDAVWCVMQANQRHTFMVLTKRPERMMQMQSDGSRGVLPNVWLGVSVEHARELGRVEHLTRTPAAVRFVSAEPLLGALDLEPWLGALDLVIAGGESGPGARPSHPDWFRGLRDQCIEADVPFFFKQWGAWEVWEEVGEEVVGGGGFASTWANAAWERGRGIVGMPDAYDERPCKYFDEFGGEVALRVGKKAAGRLLDGVEWNQMPEIGTQ